MAQAAHGLVVGGTRRVQERLGRPDGEAVPEADALGSYAFTRVMALGSSGGPAGRYRRPHSVVGV
jgi:hypothetical protein